MGLFSDWMRPFEHRWRIVNVGELWWSKVTKEQSHAHSGSILARAAAPPVTDQKVLQSGDNPLIFDGAKSASFAANLLI
jgi:hypothetical protein